jgi:Cu(I)/Ag(I) efflux system membrane fusion protein
MKYILNSKVWKAGRYFLPLLLLLATGFTACTEQQEHDHSAEEAAGITYTCPMHPQVVADEPGSCPICGMDLVPQSSSGNGEIVGIDELDLLLRPVTGMVVSAIETVRPEQDEKSISATFPGVVSYDTRNQYTIPARFGGRIETLHVEFNFQPVRKGQKLLEIYSPELLTNQRELLFLLAEDPDNRNLIESAKQKLRLLGLTDAQINQLVQSGREQYAVAVYSPYDGYVVESTAFGDGSSQGTPPSGAGGGGMGSMNAMGAGSARTPAQATQPTGELAIREGMYVEKGQPLFRVVNPSQLWAEFTVYPSEAARISKGDPIALSWGPREEQKLQTSVSFIQPFFNEGENFVNVRAYISGKEAPLRVGQLVEGEITTTTEEGLWLPALAVLDLGNKKVVFQQVEPNVFRPQLVQTGAGAGDRIQILEGISAGDAIAYNAQFLVDSESFVRVEE